MEFKPWLLSPKPYIQAAEAEESECIRDGLDPPLPTGGAAAKPFRKLVELLALTFHGRACSRGTLGMEGHADTD